MFSAVALVAFSFAGMANTGGEEKLEFKTGDILVKENPCKAVFTSALSQGAAFGMTEDEAWNYASINYNLCVAGMSTWWLP